MEKKQKTPIKSIRAFCVYCMGGQSRLVEGCTAPECPLFSYRQGRNPKMAGRRNPGSFKSTARPVEIVDKTV